MHDDLFTQSLGKSSEKPSNVASHVQYLLGDPDKGFAESDLILEREYRTPTVHQGYIETNIASASWGADNIIRVWCSTQGNFNPVREEVARALSHPQSAGYRDAHRDRRRLWGQGRHVPGAGGGSAGAQS